VHGQELASSSVKTMDDRDGSGIASDVKARPAGGAAPKDVTS
jgi:hypothetical protein